MTITDEEFINKLRNAIESGIDFDYVYNGEDEIREQIFKTDTATDAVLNLLKENDITVDPKSHG